MQLSQFLRQTEQEIYGAFLSGKAVDMLQMSAIATLGKLQLDRETISRLDEEAFGALCSLIQHYDLDPRAQRRYLGLLKTAPSCNISNQRIAYLVDRVRINLGRPQLYATQGVDEFTSWLPYPSHDQLNLASRRSAMGLESFDDQLAGFMSMIRSVGVGEVSHPEVALGLIQRQSALYRVLNVGERLSKEHIASNLSFVRNCIAEIGAFPTRPSVGLRGSAAAMNLVLFSDLATNELSEILETMKASGASHLHIAYLEDRLHLRQTSKQRIGLFWRCDWYERSWRPFALEFPTQETNLYRRALGLAPLEKYSYCINNFPRGMVGQWMQQLSLAVAY